VTPYEELEVLARREAELVAAGDWVGVVGLDPARRTILARLPESPPAEARETLERTRSQLAANAASIASSLAQARGSLEQLGQARTALAPYAAARPAPPASVELKA
jgi:hypothetical protein